jgi:streptomycin 6-kinase
MLDSYISRWNLIPDGEPIVTRAARLLPVLADGTRAMLKVATEPEERQGGALMVWWDGDGAARVLAHAGDALLLERAEGRLSLAEMAHRGCDDQACRILCAAAARLHAPRAKPVPELIPLAQRFEELEPAAAAHGGILVRCAQTARVLLGDPREVCVLHGDMHHGNVLDFGARGWLAIDPKGLAGERGFDFANIFTNPDVEDPARPLATKPEVFARRVEMVADAGRLERTRLLRWVLAWAGLSAAWFIVDGESSHRSAGGGACRGRAGSLRLRSVSPCVHTASSPPTSFPAPRVPGRARAELEHSSNLRFIANIEEIVLPRARLVGPFWKKISISSCGNPPPG